MKRLFLLLLVASITTVSLCINCSSMDKNTFKWLPTVCAPSLYPVEVVDGNFYYPGEGYMIVPSRSFLPNGWGNNTDYMLIGPDLKPIPDGLGISWFSFVENKFYTGYFDLPVDRMTEMFRTGFTQFRQKNHGTYHTILAGLAPGGIVVVWLLGDGTTKEVGCYQADETHEILLKNIWPNSTWGRMDDPKAGQDAYHKYGIERVPEVFDNLATNGIPYGLYNRVYRERFSSRVVMQYGDPSSITDEVQLKYLNGEKESLSLAALSENPFEQRARIFFLDTYWSYGRTMKNAEINIKEEEVVSAYTELYEDLRRDMPCELQVRVNATHDHIRVFLCAVGTPYSKEVELLKGKISIYTLPERFRSNYTAFKSEFD